MNLAFDWLQMVGAVVDAALLLRILGLRLYKSYIFLTLFATINVVLDVVSWYFGWRSSETTRISDYLMFVFALISPLAAWDVFEEVARQARALLRTHLTRLIFGMVFAGLLAGVMTVSMDVSDQSGDLALIEASGVLFALGAWLASMLFVWSVIRWLRVQKTELPRNTQVWSVFMIWTLAMNCLELILGALVRPLWDGSVADDLGLVLAGVGIGVSVWCVVRLRAVPAESLPAPHIDVEG